MTVKDERLVGNSFKLGFRHQNYWGDSMAIAFFSAEVGTGLFLVSYFYGITLGMIFGLLLAGTLKPYFHLAHMGVPQKSMRAILRPDRSWISRGALAIMFFIGSGIFYILNITEIFQFAYLSSNLVILDWLAQITAVLSGLVIITYQGFAMSDSESFTLWASPLLPISSAAYALTAGCLLTLIIGWTNLDEGNRSVLSSLALLFLLVDLALVFGILTGAKNKSKGGAFSVEMLMEAQFAPLFRNLTLLVGLILPIVFLMLFNGILITIISTVSMLVGFMVFRLMMFKAAVFEPITHNFAGLFGKE